MTTAPAANHGSDDLDFDGTFDRWWQSEVHPTVKPSLHSRTTHLGFAQAMVQKARELDAQARGEAIDQSQDYCNRTIAGDQ